ncbi:hypothetical protein AVEN_146542-1 [Araneus ventricosus]|uniref:Uncharacterized protein n=1 Tax=Araneus ventricosus TaxID=182803 RepID=A0A4Y2Q728_ARAVE|nr:hypothetical protein AVEN_146542-1 [Araneus ventricosus]
MSSWTRDKVKCAKPTVDHVDLSTQVASQVETPALVGAATLRLQGTSRIRVSPRRETENLKKMISAALDDYGRSPASTPVAFNAG